jgi:hypothetical protein
VPERAVEREAVRAVEREAVRAEPERAGPERAVERVERVVDFADDLVVDLRAAGIASPCLTGRV